METSPQAARPFRPWLDVRWITVAVVTVAMGSALWGLFGPEPRIVVSRETTFITSPPAPDSLPDYEAHVLSLCGAAPPPEENAAVPMLEVFWPLEMNAPSRELTAVCRALGIPDTPPTDPPLLEPEHDAVVKAAIEKSSTGSMEAARTKPWKSGDLPELSAWIERHSPAIDRLLEASRRPRYWFPSPNFLLPDRTPLIAALLPDVQYVHNTGRMLAFRAMWHLGAGRTREAWADILGIHRLSRLIAPRGESFDFLVTRMVAIAVASQANDATRQLLAIKDLGADERAMILRDLAALGPLGSIREPLHCERFFGIDVAVGLSSARLPAFKRKSFLIEECLAEPPAGISSTLMLSTSLDWNIVLKRLNADYDELDAAIALQTAAERETELKRLEGKRAGASTLGGWMAATGRLLNMLVSRSERSEQAADLIESLVMRNLSAFETQAARAEADFDALLKEAAVDARRSRSGL